MDFHTQPLVDVVPTVIKDTNEFFRRLKGLGFVPVTALMVTIDVVGLYPHIPHSEGLEALRTAVDEENAKIPLEYLVGLAKLVFGNYFEFNDRLYRQKLGTVIGTKFAPAFAKIFMANWEECFFRNMRSSAVGLVVILG